MPIQDQYLLMDDRCVLAWRASRSAMAITRLRLGEQIGDDDRSAVSHIVDALDAAEGVVKANGKRFMQKGQLPKYDLGLRTLVALGQENDRELRSVNRLLSLIRPAMSVLREIKKSRSIRKSRDLEKAAEACADFADELNLEQESSISFVKELGV